MEDELMECPFCGAIPVFMQYRKNDDWYLLSCSNKKCTIRPVIEGFPKEELVERWNTRFERIEIKL